MKTFLALSAFFASNAHGMCYIAYADDGIVTYSDSSPPFDISYPPASADYTSFRNAGGKLLITDFKPCDKLASDGDGENERRPVLSAKASGQGGLR